MTLNGKLHDPQPERRRVLRAVVSLGALALILIAPASYAETPEEKGRAIAEEMDRRDLGWGDAEVEMNMILANRQGETSVRDLRMQFFEVPDRDLGDRSLVYFYRPRDIEGTAFLTHTKILDPDDQWLYLPALKRVKRISSVNKSGPFVGSEFAYEDVVSFEVEKYAYRWLRDEPCGDWTCFVVDRQPLYENSGYTRTVAWVDQVEYRIIKVEFYDRRDALLKTLEQSEWQEYLGQYWRSHRMVMTNHQTGKATTLTFEPYRFRVGLAKGSFEAARLRRLR